MAGILDFLTGNDAAASPWGALYQDENAKRQAAASDLLASMGVSPTNAPQISPFDLPQPPAPAAPAPPATGFGAGAMPFGFAGPGSMTGINPAMLAPPAPAPGPAAPSQAQQDTMFGGGGAPAVPFQSAVGSGRPFVSPGGTDVSSVNRGAPAAADGEEDAPAAPAGRPGAPQPAAPFSLAGNGGGAGDRLKMATRGFMGNMGSGPIGALMGGLGALITGQSTDPTSIAAEKLNQSGNALLQKGASLEDVKAAVNNPPLMAALIQQYYGKDKWKVVQTGEDGMGGKTFRLMNDQDGSFKDIPGQGGGAAAAAGQGGMIGDASKSGKEYFNTIPKEYQGTVAGMLDGTIQPPTSFAASKPYWRQMLAAAKNTDSTFDENNWAARHKMSVDMGASGNSTMGGILSNGKSAFEHLKIYSNKLADVGNYNGPDIPGGALLGEAGNFVGNRLLPRAGTLDKISGANSAGLKYGQESTKFYAGSGGGEGERMAALTNNDAKSTTAAQQAGFLQTEKELMLGRLREKENQIRGTMGDGYLAKHPVMTPELQQTIQAIDANISKLRGQPVAGTAGQNQAPADSTPKLAPGQSTVINGTPIRRVN